MTCRCGTLAIFLFALPPLLLTLIPDTMSERACRLFTSTHKNYYTYKLFHISPPAGAIICYVCRADISKMGYQHFCQTAHCTHKSCNKCKLFTSKCALVRMVSHCLCLFLCLCLCLYLCLLLCVDNTIM